jgi:hypothetical protein
MRIPNIGRALVISAALSAPLVITGCVHHYDYDDGYGYNDRYGYGDGYRTYVWSNGEVPYYQQWESETRREHREYQERAERERREYWSWRSAHRDHDRDRDQYRDRDRDRDRDNR